MQTRRRRCAQVIAPRRSASVLGSFSGGQRRALAALGRRHLCTRVAVRGDKIAGSDFEQPKAGPKGVGQDARSNTP